NHNARSDNRRLRFNVNVCWDFDFEVVSLRESRSQTSFELPFDVTNNGTGRRGTKLKCGVAAAIRASTRTVYCQYFFSVFVHYGEGRGPAGLSSVHCAYGDSASFDFSLSLAAAAARA
ncbi:hypothetical protein PFISCL1PPCAC_24595, partial [Pristionchus fissidentatus]